MECNLCSSCGRDLVEIGEFYSSIKPEIIMRVVKSGQRACINCIESKLGRRLNRNDFTKRKLNRTSRREYKSAKLLNRLRSL